MPPGERRQRFALARPYGPGSNGLLTYRVVATRATEAAVRRLPRKPEDILVEREPGFTRGSTFDAGRYFSSERRLENPAGLTAAEERQYRKVLASVRRSGRYRGREKEVAARIVNKRRAGKTAPGKRSAKRRRNPPASAELMSSRVLALEYRHVGSAQRRPYRHAFRPDVALYALPDGSLLLRGARGQKLSGSFLVADGE